MQYVQAGALKPLNCIVTSFHTWSLEKTVAKISSSQAKQGHCVCMLLKAHLQETTCICGIP